MKKLTRIKRLMPLLATGLIVGGLVAHNFLYRDRSKTSANPLQQNLRLAWPPIGQAAIGTVEEGLLARSSSNEEARPMASMAKIVTALAIMEKQPLKTAEQGPTYVITKNDLNGLNRYIAEGGTVLPMLLGMKISQYQGMQRMLIASDNNMADILVDRIFGSKEAYVTYAQSMLKRMGLTQTFIADASGLSSATIGTPSELVAIGIAAIKNEVIASIVQKKQVKIPVAGTIKNTNKLLTIHGVIGIKTGTTSRAGNCLLFAARYRRKNGQRGTIVGVIMGDKNHESLYRNCKDLLESAKKSR